MAGLATCLVSVFRLDGSRVTDFVPAIRFPPRPSLDSCIFRADRPDHHFMDGPDGRLFFHLAGVTDTNRRRIDR